MNRTSQKLPLLADMLQTAVNTSEARDLTPGVKREKLGAKAQLPAVLPSRGFRVHIHRDQGRASRQSYGKGEGLLTLSYWCFDPAAAMEQLARLQVCPKPARERARAGGGCCRTGALLQGVVPRFVACMGAGGPKDAEDLSDALITRWSLGACQHWCSQPWQQ